MRNLWQLLQKNAFALTFIALMVVSTSVLLQHNGAARSSWFTYTGGVNSTIEDQRNKWNGYLHLAEENKALSEENAQLREKLLSMEMEAGWRKDTLRGWSVLPGSLVRGPDGKPHTQCLAVPGKDGEVAVGMGVLCRGAAFGSVVEVGQGHCLILPLLHASTYWSCRIRRDGPVVSLGWDGKSLDRLELKDVPRHVQAAKGDSIFTSGYDLRFPADILMGTVVETDRPAGAHFITVSVEPAADFRTSRHLEFIHANSELERAALTPSTRIP